MEDQNNNFYSGLRELLDLEVMKNYNNAIVRKAFKKIAKPGKQVLDFGAGIGTLSNIFRERYNLNPVCLEIDKRNISFLEKRKFNYIESFDSLTSKIDFVFSSNVLEHIEDDKKILITIRENLKKGGLLYLYLPANMNLWTSLDENVGHYRRYNLSDLKIKCRSLGFNIVEAHYADCLGYFAVLIWKIINKNSKLKFASRDSLIFYDQFIFPVSNFLDNLGFKFLFGKNIILVAEKIY